MARAKMVTRTVVGTQVELMVFESTTNEVTTIKQIIGGQYPDEKKLLKAVEKAVNSDTLKVLKVITSEPADKCYGMSETDFLKYAKELDPKTRKLLESNPDAEVDTEEATAESANEATAESTEEATAESANEATAESTEEATNADTTTTKKGRK